MDYKTPYRVVFKVRHLEGNSVQSRIKKLKTCLVHSGHKNHSLFQLYELSGIRPLFFSLAEKQIEDLLSKASLQDPYFKSFDPHSFFYTPSLDLPATNKILHALSRNEAIEWAYKELCYTHSTNINSKKNFLRHYQGYLDDAPAGIGLMNGWKSAGHLNSPDIALVDIEQGWIVDHEGLNISLLPNGGLNLEEYADHGAGTMGVILRKKSTDGGIGMFPGMKGWLISQWRANGELNTADAIFSALPHLKAGDILLLETQAVDPNDRNRLWPVEIHRAEFEMIRLATALGVIVIEPSGNGSVDSGTGNDLDVVRPSHPAKIFNRRKDYFNDSGAILVAAASSHNPHVRLGFSNYGSRVDCYAWGENILTAGLHPRKSGIAINTYTNRFGGTSGAAAIIAGAAICIQSIALSRHGRRLLPCEMRHILGNEALGTASINGKVVDKIGVMPDLGAISDHLVSLNL